MPGDSKLGVFIWDCDGPDGIRNVGKSKSEWKFGGDVCRGGDIERNGGNDEPFIRIRYVRLGAICTNFKFKMNTIETIAGKFDIHIISNPLTEGKT